MNSKIIFDYPNNLKIIFDKLNNNSIIPIFVGGYVRDKFLNLDSKDIDIELYGVESFEQLENILQEFGSINNVGKSFGVCKLSLKELEIDFTLPRRDNKIASGHCGFEITIDDTLDFATASSRRDFTINAMGFNPLNKKILDPFNGQKDIKNKIIRAVDLETFLEDPLRILRAVSFASRFNFVIEEELFKLCKTMCAKNILRELPSERIYTEIKKILLKSSQPSSGLKLLKRLNALDNFKPLYLLNKNNFTNILHSLDIFTKFKTSSNTTNISIILSIICYEFTKSETILFITSLTNNKQLLKTSLAFLDNCFKDIYTDSQLLHLSTRVNIENYLLFSRAIHTNTNISVFHELHRRSKILGVLHNKPDNYLRGKDILDEGIKPSVEYSNILALAYNAQLDLEIHSVEEAKKWLKNYLKNL